MVLPQLATALLACGLLHAALSATSPPGSFKVLGRGNAPPLASFQQPLPVAFVQNLAADIEQKYSGHAAFIEKKGGPSVIESAQKKKRRTPSRAATSTRSRLTTIYLTVTATVTKKLSVSTTTVTTTQLCSSTAASKSTSFKSSTSSTPVATTTTKASTLSTSVASSATAAPSPTASSGLSANIPLIDQVLNENIDEMYYGPIQIGTLAGGLPSLVPIPVNFDTGSGDLWVRSGSLGNSTTYKSTTKAFGITYGSGRVSGFVASDSTGFSPGLPSLPRFFGVITSVTGTFTQDPTSGLLGLGFTALARIPGPTPMEQRIATGALENPLLAFHLGRGKISGSKLSIGAVNPAHFSAAGSLTYFPVISPYYWGIQFASVKSNGVVIPSNTLAIIDTGTTLIVVPRALAAQIYAQIPGSHVDQDYTGEGSDFYNFPCSAKVPVSFTFYGNSKAFGINARDLIFTPSPAGNNLCVGAILGQDVNLGNGTPGLIIGDTWIKSWYSVFTYGTNTAGPTIGFIENV